MKHHHNIIGVSVYLTNIIMQSITMIYFISPLYLMTTNVVLDVRFLCITILCTYIVRFGVLIIITSSMK